MPFLVGESGHLTGQRYPLGPQGLRIGHDPGNDIRLELETVSGSHATLQAVGGQIQLHDHSTNGTWVNGQKHLRTAVTIQHGDSILVGGYAFRFDASQPAAAPGPAVATHPVTPAPATYPVAPAPPRMAYRRPPVEDYTVQAVITLLCYLFLYPVGLILNVIFLASGGSVARRVGYSPQGMTFLWVLLVLFFAAPLVVGVVFVLLLAVGLASL